MPPSRKLLPWRIIMACSTTNATQKAKLSPLRPLSAHNTIRQPSGVRQLSQTLEYNQTVSLTPSEAALALHALRLYTESKGADLGVSTKYLEEKLERFLVSRKPEVILSSEAGAVQNDESCSLPNSPLAAL